jgi:hypothetical protein
VKLKQSQRSSTGQENNAKRQASGRACQHQQNGSGWDSHGKASNDGETMGGNLTITSASRQKQQLNHRTPLAICHIADASSLTQTSSGAASKVSELVSGHQRKGNG